MGTADEHRNLHLSIMGFMPQVSRWQDLAGAVIEDRDRMIQGDELISPKMSGPTVCIYSGGPGAGGVHDHVPEQSSSRLVFGSFKKNERGTDEIDYELEVFYRSERGQKEVMKRFYNNIAEFFGGKPPHEINEAWIEEGRTLRHKGMAEFQTVHCLVPVNAADPIGYAKTMALRELGMTEFGLCRVNGGDSVDGTFKPEDGICGHSRLVVLGTPSDYFYKWKAQQERPGK